MKNKHSRHIFLDVAVGILLLAVYFAAGKLGLRLALVNVSTSAVWPPAGIALAALLLLGKRFWPVIFVGAFLVNFTTSGHLAASLVIALGNALEAYAAAYLVGRFASGKRAFYRPEDVFKFAFLAGIISTAIAASVGTGALFLGELATRAELGQVWVTWWLGDMSGILVLTPFLLLWASKNKMRWYPAKIIEAVLFLYSLILMGLTVFGGASIFGVRNYPLDFLFIPLLLWSAFRLGRRETSISVIILSAMAIIGTLHGFGPFVRSNPNESLLLLESFISVIGVTILSVAALTFERDELEDNLIGYNQQIDEEKARAEAILDSIGEALIVTDRNERVLMANNQAKEILGFGSGELKGKEPLWLFPMEDEDGRMVKEEDHPLRQAMSSGKKIVQTYYLKRKDDSRFPVYIIATPLLFGGQTIGAVQVFRDVTEERAVDRAKTEFVSLASHQLRTPLTVIKWHTSRLLEVLDKGEFNPKDQAKYLKKIYDTNERMMELVSALLNVSKIDLGTLAMEPQHVHLEDLAESVIDELSQPIKDKALTVEKKFKQPLPSISVDPQLMRIVFQNLLTNAIKYTPIGGKIICGIEFGEAGLAITVADTGAGIPLEDQNKIFSKFFRSDVARKIDPNGNGLGMYIVKAIVTAAEGTIRFESEEGKGTKFYVTIPLRGMRKKEGAKGLVESFS
jgi:PAS domain S-box-containing protein